MAWMQTYTGRAFDPLLVDIEQINIVDIGHALSLICRYGGHARQFYSVAEHSVLMSRQFADPEIALWALMHDAAEAYIGDMVTPLKKKMPAFQEAETNLMFAITHRFGMDWTCPPEVHIADVRIMQDERAVLLGPSPHPWGIDEAGVKPLFVKIECWSPLDAKIAFLARFAELTEPPTDG